MRVDYGFTASEIVARFVRQLERDPAFEPPLQADRARCDFCGAFHPSPKCLRCRPFLEEARQLISHRQNQARRLALLEGLRRKHEGRRSMRGYALHLWRNRQRRVWRGAARHAKQRIEERIGWSALALHCLVFTVLLNLCLRVPEARLALETMLLIYLGIVAILIRHPAARYPARQWKHRESYNRWHRIAVASVPVHIPLHWVAVVGIGGALEVQLHRFADPMPPFEVSFHSVDLPVSDRFWSSADEWNTWERQSCVGTLTGDALALQGHSPARVVAFYDLGRAVRYVSIAPDGSFALASSADGTLTRLQIRDGAVLARLSCGGALRDVAIALDGSFAYVADESGNEVIRVRLSDTRVEARIPVGSAPSSISFSPDGSFAIVSNHGAATLSKIRTADDRVVGTFAIGSPAWEAAVAPDDSVFVANEGGNRLRILDGENGQVRSDVALSGGPWDVSVSEGFDSGNTLALVAQQAAPRLTRIEMRGSATNPIASDIQLPGAAWDVAIAPGDQYALAAPDAKALFVVDLEKNAIRQRLSLLAAPREIAFAPDGRFVLVAAGNGVARIEGGTPTYQEQGVAQTWIATAQMGICSHLIKNEVLSGGHVAYYMAWSASKAALPVPPLEDATRPGAWRALGWAKLSWSGDRVALPAPPIVTSTVSSTAQRELHIAVFLSTPDRHRSPMVKALRWSPGSP